MARVTTREVFGTLYSESVIEKAERFVREERVAEQWDHWTVQGDHGTYRVRTNPDPRERGVYLQWCNCPLREHRESLITICSHGLAVRMMLENEKEQVA